MPTAGQRCGMGQKDESHHCTCWRRGAREGEQQPVNKLWQQLARSGGFFWRRPKHIAWNIEHAAHTEGRQPDPGETGGWRTQGREPWAVTGSARIRRSYCAEIGLSVLMLLVPLQQLCRKLRDLQERPAAVTQHRQSCSSPIPAPLPCSCLPASLARHPDTTTEGLAVALAQQQGLEKVGHHKGNISA